MRQLSYLLILLCLCSCDFIVQTSSSKNQPSFDQNAFEAYGLSGFFSWSSDRIPLVSAHRGGPYEGYPENAIETFQHVINFTPAIIECDIAMTKDSVLVLMHDNTIDRTTTGSGNITDFTWEQLQSFRLKDPLGNETNFAIPTLDEVLTWGKGKALFTLDVKRSVPFERVVRAVQTKDVKQWAAIISYNANDAKLINTLDPDLMISVSMGNEKAYDAHRALGVPDDRMIAFVGVSAAEPEFYDWLHTKGITTILGTLGNLDKRAATNGDQLYEGFISHGADILATDRPIEAAKVINKLWPKESEKYKFIKK